jgi:hypothetical protein
MDRNELPMNFAKKALSSATAGYGASGFGINFN